jgi:hypothetical protein
MPVVPTLQSAGVPGMVATPYERVSANPAAFGALQGDAMQTAADRMGAAGQRLAGTMEHAGNTLFADALQQQQFNNETRVNDIYSKDFSPQVRDVLSDFYSKQGADALRALPDASAKLTDLRAATRESLTNPAEQRMFDAISRRRLEMEQDGMARHAGQQNLVYQKETFHATLKNNVEDAAFYANDDRRFAGLISDGAHTIIQNGQATGQSEETINQQVKDYRSNAWAARITRIGIDNPSLAMKLLQDNGGEIDGLTTTKLEEHLHPKAVHQAAGALVDVEMGGGAVEARGKTPQEKERAQAIHDGLVKRGMDDATAWGFAANGLHESEGNPNEPAGDMGKSHGLFQWRDDRVQRFKDTHGGKSPEQTGLDTQLDYVMSELGGPEANAWAGIQQVKGGAGSKAAAISQLYLRPKDVEAEKQRRAATAGILTGNQTAAVPATGTFPDEAAAAQRIIDRTQDNPELQNAALSELKKRVSVLNLKTATERQDLQHSMGDAMAALEAGQDDITIPTERIKAVFPPAIATDMLAKLETAKLVGQTFKGLQWASPEEIAAGREDLAGGKGPLSAMLRVRSGKAQKPGADGPGVEPQDFKDQYNTKLSPEDEAKYQAWGKAEAEKNGGRNPAKDTFDYDMRGFWKAGEGNPQFADNGHAGDQFKKPNHPTFSSLSQYSTKDQPGGEWSQGKDGSWEFKASPYNLTQNDPGDLQKYFADREKGNRLTLPQGAGGGETPDQFALRQKMLAKYDEIAAQRQTALQKDPAAYVAGNPALQGKDGLDYRRASLVAQQQLGVPDYQQRVLTNAEAGEAVRKLTTSDPETMNVAQQMSGMANSYGDLWPKVFGELVQKGLPGHYQVLATMDRPEQAGAAADLQSMFALAKKKGGIHELEKGLGTIVKDVNDALPGQLQDFMGTTAFNAGGAELYGHVEDAAKLLAYQYAMRGQSGATAAKNAVAAIIDAKYDINGTYRTPKELTSTIKPAARGVVNNLTADDLAPIGGNPSMTDQQRRAGLLSAVRSDGAWLNNADESGIVLTYMAQGRRQPVIGKDGQPIQILFKSPPPMQTAQAQPMGAAAMPGVP